MFFHPWAFLIAVPPFWMMYVILRQVQRDKDRLKPPFNSALLRPPGEGLRIKIEALDEELIFRLLELMGPCFLALILSISPSFGFYASVVVLPFVGIFTWRAGGRLKLTLTALRNYRLGFDGERAVGQEINQALSFGCKVYHDLQFIAYNIDHVIVAPSGVYAVETKTRRKGLDKNSHKVRYDGRKLIFPEWEDCHGIEQARRNAKGLGDWLSKAVGQSIQVEPILTLPGWWIDSTGIGEITVLNPKQIVGFVTQTSRAMLSPQLFKQVCYQIEQKSLIS